MMIGAYKIGRYHAIIKNTYEDGTYSYETSFSSKKDIEKSYFCILACVGKTVGIATENPKVLKKTELITGKENIIKELKKAS